MGIALSAWDLIAVILAIALAADVVINAVRGQSVPEWISQLVVGVFVAYTGAKAAKGATSAVATPSAATPDESPRVQVPGGPIQ